MPSALSIVINNPSIRIGALAILFFGFSNAATAPAIDGLNNGETFYTWQRGIPELRQALSSYYERHFAARLPPGC